MFFIIILGILIGYVLHMRINKVFTIMGDEKIENQRKASKLTIIIITSLLFLLSFLQFGNSVVLFKALALNCVLIITSFIDFRYQLIPNKLVIITLLIGSVSLLAKDITLVNAVVGMFSGGFLLFLLALVPGSIGGGDIKFMFALGLFLGLRKVLVAIILSFILASVISIVLLISKKKGRKDYIPFGPFIALASFISYHFFSM